MKKLIAAFGLLAVSAFAVTYTRQSARVVRFQCDPIYDASGTVTSVPIQSYMVQLLVNDTDNTDVRGKSQQIAVNFDLLDSNLSATTITAAGKTVTYPQLAALMRQAVLDRATAQGVQ